MTDQEIRTIARMEAWRAILIVAVVIGWAEIVAHWLGR